MDCNRVQELLADYLGDELSTAARSDVDDHLRGCPACRGEVDSLGDVLATLRRIPAEAPAMPAADQRMTIVRMPAITRLLRPLAYAAFLAIGVGIGWWSRPALRPDTVSSMNAGDPDHSVADSDSTGGARNSPPASSQSREPRRDERRFLDVPLVRNAVALSTAFSRHELR